MTDPGYPVGSGQPVPPPNAPQARQLGVGVQPGSFDVLRARLVIVFGANEGVFVYAGTPALGNPPVFWATSASTDPYGNTIGSTVGVAGTGTFEAGDTIVNAAGQFIYSATPAAGNLIASIAPAAGTDAFGNAYLAGFATYTWSGGSPLVSMQVSGQKLTIADAPVSRSIVLAGDFAGLSSPNNLFMTPAGAGAVNPVLLEVADPAALSIPETWHTFTLQNSCTAGNDVNGTLYSPAYTLTPSGDVKLRGVVVAPAGGLTAATTWATIPAAYRPATNIPVALISNGARGVLSHVYIRPNGNCQFDAALTAGTSMWIDCTLNVQGT